MHRQILNYLGGLLLPVLAFVYCSNPQKQDSSKATLPSHKYHYSDKTTDEFAYAEKVYVPVYSEIYHYSGHSRYSLTATLSLRNTSMRDTMLVQHVDYYDSQGALLRKYLEKSILLHPLESVEFVVEYTEREGGPGANFIIDWAANKSSLKPVFQAVMVATQDQQGLSFLTHGVVVEQRTTPN
jgi:hypothetical protein